MARRGRSPNYPSIGLKTAIEQLEKFYEREGMAAVARDVAVKAWGYTATSGPALQTLSTMLQYGLLERIGGKNVKISELGLDIIKPSNPQDKEKAIQIAIRRPTIFSELFSKYPNGFPSDDALMAVLLRRKPTPYNEDSAKKLIKSFRESLDLTKLQKQIIISNNETIEVGDLVNWESQGALQFPEPKEVRGFSDDNKWAFVEGSETGLPTEELTLVQKVGDKMEIKQPVGSEAATGATPPKSPFLQPKGPYLSMDILNDNHIEIKLKSKVNSEEWKIIEELFKFSKNTFVE